MDAALAAAEAPEAVAGPLMAAAEALARARDWVGLGEYPAAVQALAEHDALLREAVEAGVPASLHPALRDILAAQQALAEEWTTARDAIAQALGDTQRGAGAARAYLDAARG